MAIAASSDLLVGQWVNSPRIRALVDAFTDTLNEDAMPALDRLALMRSIDTAEGIFLDALGRRLGLLRPATTDPAMDPRWGFSDDPDSAMASGSGFDQHPFRGDAANDAVFPLPDAVFRRILKARAILVLGDGTCSDFYRAIRELDPGADVQDERIMRVRVVTDRRLLIQLADRIGALPRSAGVSIRYSDRGRFGFSDQPASDEASGLSFDQGGLAPD